MSRGISPTVATLILVAVAVCVGLAVSFWAIGLAGILTRGSAGIEAPQDPDDLFDHPQRLVVFSGGDVEECEISGYYYSHEGTHGLYNCADMSVSIQLWGNAP